MSALIGFLEGPARNAWICSGLGQEVYVRKSFRMLDAKKYDRVLDIANINTRERKQGKGLFKRFLTEAFVSAWGQGYEVVYVENVLTPRFADYFRRTGWIEVAQDEFAMANLPCFYKLVAPRTDLG